MNTTPILLVPGFWLGAWAWDEVATALRAKGHEVTAMTLPGLESAGADRSPRTLADHVDATRDAARAAGFPRAGRRSAGGGQADQRRAPRRAEQGRLHGVHVRAVQGRRQGGPGVAWRSHRTARGDLR